MQRSATLSIGKNTLALTAGSMAVTLFSFVFTIFAARYLQADGFGTYALVFGYFFLLLSLCSAGPSIVTTREIAREPASAGRYISAALMLATGLAAAGAVFLLGLSRIAPYAPDTQVGILLAAVALVPATISSVLESVFVGFEKAEYVTYGRLLEGLVRTALSLGALILGFGVPSLFVILIATRILMAAFYLVFLHTKVCRLRWESDRTYLAQMLWQWRIFILENWLATLSTSIGLIILSFLHGERAVGIYEAAAKLLVFGNILANSYTNAIFPYLSRTYLESESGFRKACEGSFKYMLVLVLPVVVFVVLLADKVIVLLYGEGFAESASVLRIIIGLLVFRFFNPFLSFVLFARGEQTKSLRVAAASLVAQVTLCAALIPRWGAEGVAWALLLGQAFAMCLYAYYVFSVRDVLQVVAPWGRVILAAAVVGALVLFVRELHLIVVLVLGVIAYPFMLLVLRVPSTGDLDFLRMAALRGWQRARTIRGSR